MISKRRPSSREMLASDCPNRIRELRQARGLLMNDLAKLANVNFYTLCPIERSSRSVTPDKEKRIAAALGVQIDKLYREVKEND